MIANILSVLKSVPKFRLAVIFGRQILPALRSVPVTPALKNIILNTNLHGIRYSSITQRLGKIFWTHSRYVRPNSLINAFNGLSTIARYRDNLRFDDITFSKLYSPLKPFGKMRRNYVRSFCLKKIKPANYLSRGASGAVWAAKSLLDDSVEKQCRLFQDDNDIPEQKDWALKVLYNYYASSPADDEEENSGLILRDYNRTRPENWHLLHKQRDREINLRPPGSHSNIVPILGDFFGRAPPSKIDLHKDSDEAGWENIENFTYGFGGRPNTWYLLMPRFDGSLDDLLNGNEKLIEILSAQDSVSSPIRSCYATEGLSKIRNLKASLPSGLTFRLPTEEAVGLMAQIVEAVAHLERYHTAHRDIKPSNFLVKARDYAIKADVLNVEMAKAANMRLQVALTDFGCAIRTDDRTALLPHSGNTALWAPEVAKHFQSQQASHQLWVIPAFYSRADLWAAGTFAYQLFGQSNPFLSGKLSPLNYEDQQLPVLPTDSPGVMTWLLYACLRQNPSHRPPACLVADVLHTWCLFHQLRRLFCPRVLHEVVPRVQLPAEVLVKAAKCDSTFNSDDLWLQMELDAVRFSRLSQRLHDPLRKKLRQMLQLSWATDWLLGAAKNAGLRVFFYQRITLERFAFCLALVQFSELLSTFKPFSPSPY